MGIVIFVLSVTREVEGVLIWVVYEFRHVGFGCSCRVFMSGVHPVTILSAASVFGNISIHTSYRDLSLFIYSTGNSLCSHIAYGNCPFTHRTGECSLCWQSYLKSGVLSVHTSYMGITRASSYTHLIYVYIHIHIYGDIPRLYDVNVH